MPLSRRDNGKMCIISLGEDSFWGPKHAPNRTLRANVSPLKIVSKSNAKQYLPIFRCKLIWSKNKWKWRATSFESMFCCSYSCNESIKIKVTQIWWFTYDKYDSKLSSPYMVNWVNVWKKNSTSFPRWTSCKPPIFSRALVQLHHLLSW